MLQSDDVGGAPQLGLEAWTALLRSNCGDSAEFPQLFWLRYAQRILARRGTGCGESIDSHRPEHAARLLHHRTSFGTNRPLDEIAYAGRDSGGDAVRAGTGKSASPTRDVAFRTS